MNMFVLYCDRYCNLSIVLFEQLCYYQAVRLLIEQLVLIFTLWVCGVLLSANVHVRETFRSQRSSC